MGGNEFWNADILTLISNKSHWYVIHKIDMCARWVIAHSFNSVTYKREVTGFVYGSMQMFGWIGSICQWCRVENFPHTIVDLGS